MNLTPLTDEEEVLWGKYKDGGYVDSKFARELELMLFCSSTLSKLRLMGRETKSGLNEIEDRVQSAISSSEEERKRADREAQRVALLNNALSRILISYFEQKSEGLLEACNMASRIRAMIFSTTGLLDATRADSLNVRQIASQISHYLNCNREKNAVTEFEEERIAIMLSRWIAPF